MTDRMDDADTCAQQLVRLYAAQGETAMVIRTGFRGGERDCMTGKVTEEPVELIVVTVTDGPAHKSLYLTEEQARVLRDVLGAALRNVR